MEQKKRVVWGVNREKTLNKLLMWVQFKSRETITPFTPQPYRITIKLSGANPSAPAETVTKALRTAGVSFEVEMIERIEDESALKDSRSGRSKR